MEKKLVIKFWKAHSALAMQIVEQYGLPEEKETGDVRIADIPEFYKHTIYLRGKSMFDDFNIDVVYFDSKQKRDECLDRITKAITDELFDSISTSELKIGEMCEARINEYHLWDKCKLLAILPEKYDKRYIVNFSDDDDSWMAFKEARPLCKRIEPKVETNGEIVTYTWEEE